MARLAASLEDRRLFPAPHLDLQTRGLRRATSATCRTSRPQPASARSLAHGSVAYCSPTLHYGEIEHNAICASRREPCMWQSLILGFLAGVFGANGLPHFVKGITKETYPCVLGNSPVPNLIAGWAGLVIAAVFAGYADYQHYALQALLAGAIGALLIGLFHAAIGAFGR
jgi:hypothetical protein